MKTAYADYELECECGWTGSREEARKWIPEPEGGHFDLMCPKCRGMNLKEIES